MKWLSTGNHLGPVPSLGDIGNIWPMVTAGGDALASSGYKLMCWPLLSAVHRTTLCNKDILRKNVNHAVKRLWLSQSR